MSEYHDAPPAGLAGTVDHVDAGDGWLVVRLMTRQALRREGEHMGHCLADGNYDELRGEEEMTGNAIWSLRDPAGMSRATLDVRHRRVVMAKGKGNSDVGGKAARRLKALVAAFRAAGQDLEFNGETGLVVAPNGYVCREDQAPPEVIEAVRAKHRAAVEAARQAREGLLASRRWYSQTLRGTVKFPDGTVHEVELYGSASSGFPGGGFPGGGGGSASGGSPAGGADDASGVYGGGGGGPGVARSVRSRIEVTLSGRATVRLAEPRAGELD